MQDKGLTLTTAQELIDVDPALPWSERASMLTDLADYTCSRLSHPIVPQLQKAFQALAMFLGECSVNSHAKQELVDTGSRMLANFPVVVSPKQLDCSGKRDVVAGKAVWYSTIAVIALPLLRSVTAKAVVTDHVAFCHQF